MNAVTGAILVTVIASALKRLTKQYWKDQKKLFVLTRHVKIMNDYRLPEKILEVRKDGRRLGSKQLVKWIIWITARTGKKWNVESGTGKNVHRL